MYCEGNVLTTGPQLCPAGHCKKIGPCGEPQSCPTTSISGGAPSSAPTASAVHVWRQLISPEFVLPVTMQHTWLPVQSAFWSQEMLTVGPKPPLGKLQVLPLPQAKMSWLLLRSSIEQQTLLPLHVWLPHCTLGP
jgi:hypothetical protein